MNGWCAGGGRGEATGFERSGFEGGRSLATMKIKPSNFIALWGVQVDKDKKLKRKNNNMQQTKAIQYVQLNPNLHPIFSSQEWYHAVAKVIHNTKFNNKKRILQMQK